MKPIESIRITKDAIAKQILEKNANGEINLSQELLESLTNNHRSIPMGDLEKMVIDFNIDPKVLELEVDELEKELSLVERTEPEKESSVVERTYTGLTTLKQLSLIEDYLGQRTLDTSHYQILMKALGTCRIEVGKAMVGDSLTEEQIGFITSSTSASFTVNKKGVVNINGDFNCRGVSHFYGIKFGTIKGSFIVTCSKISSFENFPEKIKGDLDISNNQFKTIDGIKEVHGSICLNGNPLVSIRGIDKISVSRDIGRYAEGSVSPIVLGLINYIIRKKKFSYEEAISFLEPHIKMGVKLNQEYIKSHPSIEDFFCYSREKGRDTDWELLDKGGFNQDLGKGLRTINKFGII